MGRLARVVAAGIPHHVTQRGNRRQQTFFCEDDYREYISLMAEEKEIKEIRRHERTGSPLGRDGFVLGLEKALGRTLRYQRSGPKGKKKQ
jgi:putative transposase